MNAKAKTQSISRKHDLPHPPAKVWRALTEPEPLAAWLLSNDTDLLRERSARTGENP